MNRFAGAAFRAVRPVGPLALRQVSQLLNHRPVTRIASPHYLGVPRREFLGGVMRVVMNMFVSSFGAIVNGFSQALTQEMERDGKSSQAQREALNPRMMKKDEALKVLNFEESEEGSLTPEEVEARFTKYFELNDPSKGGSFYLQSKFYRARETLLKSLEPLPDPPSESS